MASEVFMLASLAERGLLLSMLAHAWMNGTVPADRAALARMLSTSEVDVERSFGDLVNAHFSKVPDNETRLFCQDLERQKQRMSKIRAQQAAGGRMTARARREAAANKANSHDRLATSSPSRSALAPELNGTEANTGIQGEALERHKQWLQDFDS